MMYKKKLLALAVTSAFAGTAFGVANPLVNLDNPGTTAALTLASEMTVPNATPVSGWSVNGQTGWGFSSGTAVFVRYDLGNSATFRANPTAFTMNMADGTAPAGGNTNATTSLSTGGTGLGYVIYQISSANSTFTSANANMQLILGDNAIIVPTAASTTLTQSVYDTSGNAVAGTSTGRLTTKSATLVSFAPSYTFSLTAGTAQTADVNATAGTYKAFTGGISTGTVALGSVNLANGATTVVSNSGVTSTANIVLASTSSLIVTGDFTAAANANGTYTAPALSRVFLGNTTTCASGIISNSLTATTATFPINYALTPAANNTLCLTTEGNSAIPAATYTAVFAAKGATGYAPATVSTSVASLGSIIRNGGQLTSPWFSTASGWISRFILTNTSSAAAAYTISVVTESGNTATTVPAGLSGSVPANGMVVINASDFVSAFSGSSRGAATFTFQSGRGNINGVYQVVNAASGAIASQTMVAPGTN